MSRDNMNPPKNQLLSVNYPLPGRVNWKTVANKASNFGLLFQRLIGYPNRWEIKGTEKSKVLKEQVLGRCQDIFKRMQPLAEALEMREKCLFEGYQARFGPQKVDRFEMTLDARLVIGFGSPSVFETGISLHRIYGIPYLPSSAIKGVTRHFWLTDLAERLGIVPLDAQEIKKRSKRREKTPWEQLEELLMADAPQTSEERKFQAKCFESLVADPSILDGPLKRGEYGSWQNLSEQFDDIHDFCRAFGNTSRRGAVIFFDAFPDLPKSGLLLESDIINTHYQEYYTGDQPPADYLSPVPVYFLSVLPEIQFRFMLASEHAGLLGMASKWLKDTLVQAGIGSKTHTGYGYFRHPSSNPATPDPASPSKKPLEGSPMFKSALQRLGSCKPTDAGQIGSIIQDLLQRITDPNEKDLLAQAIQDKLGDKAFQKHAQRDKILACRIKPENEGNRA